MSTTPLCDANVCRFLDGRPARFEGGEVVRADFARQLETVLRNVLFDDTLPAPCNNWKCSHDFAVDCVRYYITAELERIGREGK